MSRQTHTHSDSDATIGTTTFGTTTFGTTANDPAARRPLWGHWPSLLGLAVATWQILLGTSTEGTAITVAAAASCYLAAAALGRRWIAWVGIVTSSLVVLLTEAAGLPWWAGLTAYTVLLVVVGLAARARCDALSEQALAMLGFGGLAVLALFVSPRLGLALAGLVLVSHALWDYRHWRRNDVVPRSMAEFCFLLDVPLGVAALVLALT